MHKHAILISILWVSAPAAWGFSMSPDAGAMLNQMEQSAAAREVKPVEGLPIEYYPRMRWTDEFSIQVDAIVMKGNTLVSEQKIQATLKNQIGKRIAVQRLSSITRLVEKAYRDAGYRAQAYVPEQSFAGGKLVIQVIEK